LQDAPETPAPSNPPDAAGGSGLPAAPTAFPELVHFFNQSPDLLCIADFAGGFKRLNPAWSSTLGWSCEELQTRPFLHFVHPADRPATLAEMAKLDAGALTISFENRYRCKDGALKWLQWTARPVPERQEIYAIARDVTLRKQLKQQVLETLDHERERMSRELHDGLCQDLAGIAALSASLTRKLTSKAEVAAAREIGKLLNDSIRQARDLARGGNPEHLESIGLAAALNDFCLKTQNHFQVSCTFHCASLPPRLGVKREAHLYRIAQEAVNNAISHGRAETIWIRLACHKVGGTLEIQDDGCGIGDLSADHPGLGVHSMTYRASLIGGKLELKTTPPRGTLVTCVFSLLSPTPHH
jgi:PAS domain S-box-containing protein